MINAAEQIFKKNNGYSSLIWLDFHTRPLIFLIRYGAWKGFPDLWDGEIVKKPHPGTGRGFAFLIERAGLGDLLGAPLRPEQPYKTEIRDDPFWEFKDSYGRLLRLELPGMNVHVEYP